MSEMRELTDTELDAVCGGFFNFGNIVTQTNIATQVGVAIGGISGITGGNAGNASRRTAARSGKLQHYRLNHGCPHTPWLLPGCAGTNSIENSHGHERPRSRNYGKRVSTRCLLGRSYKLSSRSILTRTSSRQEIKHRSPPMIKRG